MLPLWALAQECAPQVAPSTMAAIVRVESGGNPLAMYNNSTGQSIRPPSLAQAIATLRASMALGQKVDVGLAQVDTENFAAFGLTPENAFNACTNLSVGARILEAGYRQALENYGPGQVALYHAFEAYNNGHLWGDASYANRILAAAGLPVLVSAGGGLRYEHRAAMPLVFTLGWGAPAKPSRHGPKPASWSPFALGW